MQDERYTVDEQTGCWTWQRATNASGYGKLGLSRGGKRQYWLAHRWYWTQEHGDIPEGIVIDHLCRNRRCVNTEHMELVTPGENQRRGVRIKMTPARITDIRSRYRNGESVRSLAASFGVANNTVWSVVTGSTWDLGGVKVDRDA